MKERPILFSGPMVRAILDGRKTQTRRIMKPQVVVAKNKHGYETHSWNWHAPNSKHGAFCGGEKSLNTFVAPSCPHGKPGDRLWVRETAAEDVIGSCAFGSYIADGSPVVEHGMRVPWWYSKRQCPSIHMPRWASRILLEITSVRVERLQDMEGQAPYLGESDALAEGVNRINHGDGDYYFSAFRDEPHPKNWCDPTDAFRELWESINGAGSWDTNPWVWVISFKRVQP